MAASSRLILIQDEAPSIVYFDEPLEVCRHIQPARSRCGPYCALAFLPINLEIVDRIFNTKKLNGNRKWKLAFPPINLEIVEWIFITKTIEWQQEMEVGISPHKSGNCWMNFHHKTIEWQQEMESAKWIIKGSPPLASAHFLGLGCQPPHKYLHRWPFESGR